MSLTIQDYIRSNQERFLGELKTFLRIPSVSTLPEHKPDIERAAQFVADEFRRIGMTHVELIPTEGHPLVYAEWLGAPGKPILLCYGHYDVQPPDPLDLWKSPPFEPDVRDGNIYARGAADDKGQFFTHLKAAEGFLQPTGKLPINVKFLIEGEEEVGGKSIESYVSAQRDKLRADAALVSDTEMFAPGFPTLDVGLRGLVYLEVHVRGASHDLHSGLYGGAAPNPLMALAEILTACKDRRGRILIPGFYRRVKKVSRAELVAWKRLPFNEKKWQREAVGASALVGEKGYSVLERIWGRPTFEVHGIAGGFTAAGAKTVIPAEATAKVSMRLVPDQKPAEIVRLFQRHVEKVKPNGVKLSVRVLSQAPAVIVPTDNPYLQAAVETLEEVFGQRAVFVRSGGSIPVVTLFAKALKTPVVMMGWGLPDDNLHAPNEKLNLGNFYKGIECTMHYFERVAALRAPERSGGGRLGSI
ncbi:MAG: dipeptidase [Terriglobia bacterium]